VAVLTHPKRKTPSDLYTLSPYEFDLPAEAVTFPPRHGDYRVTGWYIPYPQATTTILVCPGYRSRAADVLGICAYLWKAGHNVLVFEFYGHGIPVGTSVTLGYCEVNDFLGAITYAKELWLLPDAGHCGAYFADRQAYVAKIETFFRRSLARVPHRSAS
jgi:hypothetical protein